MNFQVVMSPGKRCSPILVMPLGLAKVAATAAQRVTISMDARKVGRKVDLDFVRLVVKALAGQLSILPT